MRPIPKSLLRLSAAWLATIVAAYWLGGKHVQPQTATTASDLTGHAPDAERGSRSSGPITAAGAGGTRPLPSPGDRRTSAAGAPDRILNLLDGSSGADLERSEFRRLAETMSLDEVVAIIGQISTMDPGPAQRDAYTEVLSRWAQLDATAALEHVAKIAAPELRNDAAINVLRHWAAVDPAAAVAYVEGGQDNDLPDGSLNAVFRGIGHSMDTTAALGFLASLEGSGHHKHAYTAVRELYERNDKEVIEWTQSLPDGEIRERSIHALMNQWARYDPIAAKAWLEENTSESNRGGALAALAESWAQNDPESAVSLAMTIGDGDGDTGDSRKVLDRVFRRWIQNDIASAAGYLVEQEPSPGLDGALEQYIQRVKNVDPDATMAWAESISDPKRRRNAVLHVAKIWRSQDPQAYASYVETSPVLTDKERDKLLGKQKEKTARKQKKKS